MYRMTSINRNMKTLSLHLSLSSPSVLSPTLTPSRNFLPHTNSNPRLTVPSHFSFNKYLIAHRSSIPVPRFVNFAALNRGFVAVGDGNDGGASEEDARPSIPVCAHFFSTSNKKKTTMKAVVITSPGDPDVLKLQEVNIPDIKDNEVLIKVAATALNRADTLQRKGSYPPPKGANPYPGLECSGTVEAVGKNVSRWKIGDQVCALLSGGGYAEKVAVPAGQVLPVPPAVSLKDAASFPEVACTVWSTVFMTSRLSAGETFLVHGGSSGIGTFAIQIAKHQGARVFVTAGSEEKLAVCKDLGAEVGINYKTEDFVARVKEETGGKGVDVILDNIGGPYFQRNLDSLNVDGRLFIIGFQGGTVTEANLTCLLARRLTVQAAGLRNRSPENKAVIVNEVVKNVWPAITAGKVKPVVYKYLPLSEAAEAHRLMESSKHIGKILLVP